MQERISVITNVDSLPIQKQDNIDIKFGKTEDELLSYLECDNFDNSCVIVDVDKQDKNDIDECIEKLYLLTNQNNVLLYVNGNHELESSILNSSDVVCLSDNEEDIVNKISSKLNNENSYAGITRLFLINSIANESKKSKQQKRVM